MNPNSHDTVVFAAIDGKIIFFQTFDYLTQEKEAQEAVTYAIQLSKDWHFGYLPHFTLEHVHSSHKKYTFDLTAIPIPNSISQVGAVSSVAAPILSVSPQSIQKEFYSVHLDDAGRNKLNVVKLIKHFTGLGLVETKELVDEAPVYIVEGTTRILATQLVNDLVNVGAKAHFVDEVTGNRAAPDTNTNFSVYLVSAGKNKLNVVKALKNFLAIDLQQAKDLIDTAPSVINNLGEVSAGTLVASLQEAGAEAFYVNNNKPAETGVKGTGKNPMDINKLLDEDSEDTFNKLVELFKSTLNEKNQPNQSDPNQHNAFPDTPDGKAYNRYKL